MDPNRELNPSEQLVILQDCPTCKKLAGERCVGVRFCSYRWDAAANARKKAEAEAL